MILSIKLEVWAIVEAKTGKLVELYELESDARRWLPINQMNDEDVELIVTGPHTVMVGRAVEVR